MRIPPKTRINTPALRAPIHLTWRGDGDLTPDGFGAGLKVDLSKEAFSFSLSSEILLKSEKPFHLCGYHGSNPILMSFPCGSSFHNEMVPRHTLPQSAEERICRKKRECFELICSCSKKKKKIKVQNLPAPVPELCSDFLEMR